MGGSVFNEQPHKITAKSDKITTENFIFIWCIFSVLYLKN